MSAHYPAVIQGESFAYYAHRVMALHSVEEFDLTSAARHYALSVHGVAAVNALWRHAGADRTFQRFMKRALSVSK
jgi:hypothetical protein